MASNLGGVIILFIALVSVMGLLLWAINVAKDTEDEAFANQTSVNPNYFPLLTELKNYMWVGLPIIVLVGIGVALIGYGRGEQ
jgi:hypothetical protein